MSESESRRYRILVIGPVVLDEVHLGGSDDVIREAGGNAARVAMRLAQCGVAASVLAQIGRDRAGLMLSSRLAREDVDIARLRSIDGQSTKVAPLELRTDGEWFHRRPPETAYRYLGDLEPSTAKRVPREFDALFIAGANSLLRTDSDDVERLVHAFHDEGRSVVCGLNRFGDRETETATLLRILDTRRDLVFGNRDEMRHIVESTVLVRESARPGHPPDFTISDRIIEALPFDRFVMTCGGDGVIARDGGSLERIDPPAVERVASSIGAGDVFAATYVAARAKGRAVACSLAIASRSARRHIRGSRRTTR